MSYDQKHYEANGEGNADGENHNRSWNCGAEGPTDDPAVEELRGRQQRNLLTTLVLSQGVPMILMGDEVGRSQRGNNNAYCQDDEISWLDWSLVDTAEALLDDVRRLLALRRDHPVLRRRRWFVGSSIRGSAAGDIAWLRPDGQEMTDDDWSAPFARSMGVYLNGHAIPWPGPRGETLVDDDFLVLFNAGDDKLAWTLPGAPFGERWALVMDTALAPMFPADEEVLSAGEVRDLADRSVVVLRRV